MPSAGFSLPTAAQQNGSTWSPGQVTAAGQASITSKVYLWSGQLYEALPSLVVEHRLHKSLWPLGTRDFLGFGIATLGLFIAAGGGIGGGAILVPVYLIVLGFTPKNAVALSNITIMGGALANLMFNIRRRHATADRPLIDWDLILVMEPATILGAVFGGFLNKLAPTWALTILLAGLLTAITWKLIMRGLHTWSQESESMRQLAEARAALTQDELEQPLLASQGGATAEQGSQGQGQAKRLQAAGAAASSPRALGTRDVAAPYHRSYSAAVMDESFWIRERQADSPPGSPSAAGEEASLSRFHRTLGTTPTPTYAQVLMSGASLPPGTRRGVLFSPCAGSLSGQGSEAPAPGGRGSRLWQPPRPPLSEQALLQQQEQQHSADQALRGVSPGSLQHSVAAALAAAEAAGGMPPESPSAASSRLGRHHTRAGSDVAPTETEDDDEQRYPSSPNAYSDINTGSPRFRWRGGQAPTGGHGAFVGSLLGRLEGDAVKPADLRNGMLPDSEAHKQHADPEAGNGASPQLQHILTQESRQVPPLKLGVLVVMFAGVLFSDLLKDKAPCARWLYWLVVLSLVPFTFVISAVVRRYLVRKFHAKEAASFVWQEGDVPWTERNTVVYPTVCSLAGLVAGMFGVGGGIVKGPLMLEMGVLPDVAAATCATMILFTAASASVIYLTFGGLSWDYAGAVFVLGLVVTLAGQGVCYWLMDRLQRRSIIIFSMAGLLTLSSVVIYWEAVTAVMQAINTHTLLSFGSICSNAQ